MKLTIFLIIALFAIAHAEPNCKAEGYCMGCDNSVADKCTDCYNGVVSTIEPRYLSGDNCNSKVTAFGDCDLYSHSLTSGTVSTTTVVPTPGCWRCGNSKMLQATSATTTLANEDTFKGNTGITALACVASTTDGTNADCLATLYIRGSDNANSHAVCLITNVNKCFKNNLQTSPDLATCTGTFTNCANTIINYANDTNGASGFCHDPNAEHAVKSDRLTATSFTNDANCRRLQSDNQNCALCKDTYWFHGSKCYMRSGLIFLSAVAFFVAWFF